MKASRLLCLAALVSVVLSAAPATAQDREEIIVTGARYSRDFDSVQVPHVAIRKRADFLVHSVRAVCDTRDSAKRRDELAETLRNMLAAAEKDAAIELAIGEDIVLPFTKDNLGNAIGLDTRRADTEYASVLVKTPIAGDKDTFDGALGRLKAFVEGVKLVGRTEMLFEGQPQLTVVGPGQYRHEIVKAMAADAKLVLDALGPGYAARVGGLERRVAWVRSDVLELTLFIPHELEIGPVEAGAP